MNGLFGTFASLYTDIGLIFVQLSMFSAIIARYFIWKKKPSKHRIFMILGVILLYLFLFFYILNYIENGIKTFGGTGLIQIFYYIFLLIHTLGASSLGIISTVLIIRSIKRTDNTQENEWKKFNFEKEYRSFHKKIGKLNTILWIFTAISGLMVYLLLYVFFEPVDLL